MSIDEKNINYQQKESISGQPDQKLVEQGQFLLARFRAETDIVSRKSLTDEQRKRIKANVLKNMNQPTLNLVETQTSKSLNAGQFLLKFVAPVAAVFLLSLGLIQVANLFRAKDAVSTLEKGIFTNPGEFLAPELAIADEDASRDHLRSTETKSPVPTGAECDKETMADSAEEHGNPAESLAATMSCTFAVKAQEDFDQWNNLFVQILEQAQWIRVNNAQISELRDSIAQIGGSEEINLTFYQNNSPTQTAWLGYLCLSIDFPEEQPSYITQTESLLKKKGLSFDLIRSSKDMLEFLSATEAQLKQTADQIIDTVNWTGPGDHILIWLLAK
ncbi:MAG: hypothetical protein ACOX3P_06800 [Saccharofermentanales bacterium]|jgi:hypothetical protein